MTTIRGRLGVALATSGLAAAAAIVFGLAFGSVSITPSQWLSGDPVAAAVVALRWPRVALAGATGAALALAGGALQALLRNPLGDPFLLGTSGGAAAGAALATLAGASALSSPIAAFGGALGATMLVAAISRRDGRMDLQRLLLAGVVANAFFSAMILLALALASGPRARSMIFWMMGSLAGARAGDLVVPFAGVALGAAVIVASAPALNLILSGEDDARSLGVSVEATKIRVFVVASLLTGVVTAFCGIIGFVGLLAPHLARLLWGNDQRVLLPASALTGAAILVASDALSRVLLSPAEVPIGAVTALLGVPFFVVLLARSS